MNSPYQQKRGRTDFLRYALISIVESMNALYCERPDIIRTILVENHNER